MATSSWNLRNTKLPNSKQRATFAYRMLVVFTLLYFARPEDLIPGMRYVPMEKIAGGIALLALVAGASARRKTTKWPTELKLLLAFFLWQCLGVPFAFYRMGALSWVINRCSKGLIVAWLVGLLLESTAQLRLLLWIQAASVAAITFFSIVTYQSGRLGGVLGGVFGNPNDLAINIALNWPLCWLFLLSTRNPLKKALWAAAMLMMVWGLMLTYSRSGFLALAVAVAFSLWEFGIRGRRLHLLAAAALLAIGLLFLGPAKYADRLKSIFSGKADTSSVDIYGGDARQARTELLLESLKVTAAHPLLGVGAGQFQAYSQLWRVSHNTYTEISAETGVPALLLFLAVLVLAFRNLSRTRRTPAFASSPEIRLYAGGLWAALASYVTGAMFASTAYNLFPYFLIAYTTALYRITHQPAPDSSSNAMDRRPNRQSSPGTGRSPRGSGGRTSTGPP
jgi:O-antigen ligase